MILEPTEQNIRKAAEELRQGLCVAFPTETVYGLGADATHPSAVAKIYGLKGRPATNPLIVHVIDMAAIDRVADTSRHRSLIAKLAPLWPGPLTVILPRLPTIPALVAAGGDTIGVRIPAHPVAQRLLREANLPIAAPSANKSTRVSPTRAEHVHGEFGENILTILDGGPCPVGIESTVLSLVTPEPTILRPGSITAPQLATYLGTVHTRSTNHPSGTPLPSPGLLGEHYAPRTRTILWSPGDPSPQAARWGLISISDALPALTGFSFHRSLSPDGNLELVARNLFATLRTLDEQQLELIVVERCPGEGIGVAIMDRLQRASARN